MTGNNAGICGARRAATVWMTTATVRRTRKRSTLRTTEDGTATATATVRENPRPAASRWRRRDNGDDCNDDDADVSPCRPRSVMESTTTAMTRSMTAEGIHYLDEDGDGFGVTESSITSCTLPEGYVVDDGDCNDDISAINPDAEEPCDEVDNDCDGEIDEEGLSTWYEDADGDGYGTDTSTIEACAAIVEGYAAYEGDCDDTNGDVNPDADEVCDEIDNDCDGDVDSGAIDA